MAWASRRYIQITYALPMIRMGMRRASHRNGLSSWPPRWIGSVSRRKTRSTVCLVSVSFISSPCSLGVVLGSGRRRGRGPGGGGGGELGLAPLQVEAQVHRQRLLGHQHQQHDQEQPRRLGGVALALG